MATYTDSPCGDEKLYREGRDRVRARRKEREEKAKKEEKDKKGK